MNWGTIIWTVLASVCGALAGRYPPDRRRMRRPGANLACAWAVALGCLAMIDAHAANSKATFRSDPDYLIDTWETEDGLPENSATAMIQTSDGYLWFGTFNGLVRFDGFKFTIFNPANTPELPSAAIVNLHLDHSRRMWISTDRGLVVHEGKSWRSFGTNEGWVGNVVRTFAERANGDLLITTFDGHVLEFANDRLVELPPPPTGQPRRGYLGAVDTLGQWWITQMNFLGRWDGQRWVQTVLPVQVLRDSSAFCASARDGGLWCIFGKYVFKYRQGEEVARVPLLQMTGGIWSIYEDSRTNVWICSFDSGLFRLNPSGSLQHWTATNGLGNAGCRFVFEDLEGNLWVGTSGGGLNRFKPRRFQEVASEGPLSKCLVKSVSPASDAGMWIATYDKGLFRCDSAGISHVAVPLSGLGRDSVYGLSVLEDRAGRTWYGEKDGCWWRRGPGSFEKVPLAWAMDANVSALFEDSKGRIWLSSGQGVVMYDGNVFHEFGADAGLPPGVIACFSEDHAGVLWLTAREGVFRYEKDRFVEVRSVDATPLPEILCLKADPDGTMWMGTRAKGLLRLREGRLSKIGEKSGLPVDTVHAIIDDNLGYFWMASDRGIVRVSKTNLCAVADGALTHLDCQLLDYQDGLPSRRCPIGQPTCARDATGHLWFATEKGVAMIDPKEFRLNLLRPSVHIEQLDYQSSGAGSKTGNRQPSGDPAVERVRLVAPFPAPLRLPAGSYGLEIEYTAISFSSPEKVRFQTRLEGSHREWEDAPGSRIARFYQLPQGDYVFRVRAANDDGVWNETGASLAFSVLPFFWQTWWFRVASLTTLLSFAGLTSWWRAHLGHQRKLAELERTRRQETELAHVGRVALMGELASSLAHELNQPLGAILRNTEAAELFLQDPSPDLEEVVAILGDIRKDDQRAGAVIDRMRAFLKRREIQSIRLDLNTLIAEVVALVRLDAQTRQTVLVFEPAPTLSSVMGDRVQLQQVMLNLFLNAMDAMKDCPVEARRLVVRVQALDREVEVAVRDAGHGIATESLDRVFEPFFTTKDDGLGIGLALSRTIITIHGGRIWAENNPDRGATLRVRLPAAPNESA